MSKIELPSDELLKMFGVIDVKVDSERFTRFFFKKNQAYIAIEKLDKYLADKGLKIYGFDPNQMFLDVEVIKNE